MTTANTWPDPYLVSSLHDPRIEQTIHGLSRKVQIHALSSAIHGLSLVRGLRTTDTCNRAASLMSSCTHSFVRVHDCEVQQWQSNVIINDIAKSSMPQQCSMMRTSTGSFVRCHTKVLYVDYCWYKIISWHGNILLCSTLI